MDLWNDARETFVYEHTRNGVPVVGDHGHRCLEREGSTWGTRGLERVFVAARAIRSANPGEFSSLHRAERDRVFVSNFGWAVQCGSGGPN